MIKSRSISKNIFSIFPSWNFYSLLIFIIICMFQLSNWPKLPLFMDCYYHLSVMRGFSDAGGWTGTAFWEYAPFGRPHLYPPLFHIVELFLFKCGLAAITIAHLFDFIIFPAFLFVAWWVIRRLYSPRMAFFSLLLLTSSFALYLSVVNNIPFTLSIIFGLLAFYFLKKSRLLSSLLFLTLSFYTHTLASWLLVLVFSIYALVDKTQRRSILLILAGSILTALPLLWHQLKFLDFIVAVRVMDFYFVELELFLYVLAFFGFIIAVKKKGAFLFLLSLTLGMLPLFLIYQNRFLSGHGLIPIVLLAAVSLNEAWQWLSKLGRLRKLYQFLFIALITLFSHFFTPLLVLFSPFKKGADFIVDFGTIGCLETTRGYYLTKFETLYNPKLINEIVRIVEENCEKDDILFSNYNYTGGMVSVLSHRATSNAMLAEVRPFEAFDKVACARLILWFKEPSGKPSGDLEKVIDKYSLKQIGQTQLVYVYLNENTHSKMAVLPARVPYRVCAGILLLIFFAILLDNRRPGLKREFKIRG